MLGVANLLNTASGIAPLEKKPEARSSMRVPIALLFLAIGWYVAVRVFTESRTAESDRRAIALASDLFTARVGWSKKNLEAIAELIADDPRMKTTLGAVEDHAMLPGLIADLKIRVSTSVIAVIDPQGSVIACIGEERLKGMDLRDSKLIREAVDSATPRSGVWGFKERLLAVSVRSVLLGGSKMIGLVLVADEIGEPALREISGIAGVDAALLIAGRSATMTDGSKEKLFARAKELPANDTATFHEGNDRFVARVEDISNVVAALPTRLVWLRTSDEGASRSEKPLIWLPVIATILYGCVAAWRSIKR